MAQFAKLVHLSRVIDVTIVSDVDSPDEAAGIAFLQSIFGGEWVQTFEFDLPYPDPYPRGKYAAIGDTWDVSNQVFVSPPNPLLGE